MNLTEFLIARIAEDEEAAKATQRDSSYGWSDTAFTEAVELAEGEGAVKEATRHIEQWSPARVLAECEAKRGIIEAAWGDLLRIEGEWGHGRGQDELSALNDYPVTLQLLAEPYASHSDYDEAWRA